MKHKDEQKVKQKIKEALNPVPMIVFFVCLLKFMMLLLRLFFCARRVRATRNNNLVFAIFFSLLI